MKRRPQYFVLTGIGILACVVLVLLVSPDFIFSPTITVIGSDLSKTSSNQVSVVTRTDFSKPEQMTAFPQDIGKWHGVEYDSTETAKELGASAVLLRGYIPETFSQPLFLTILQSRSDSSFHDPETCFKFQGYTIQDNTVESLSISNSNWAVGQQTISLPLNKIVVTMVSPAGVVTERRAVLFFYVKGNQFYSDTITLIEVQALTPLQGPDDGTLKEEKDFIYQITPLLFQPARDSGQTLISSLIERGLGGYITIALLFLIPIVIILYPFIWHGDRSR